MKHVKNNYQVYYYILIGKLLAAEYTDEILQIIYILM